MNEVIIENFIGIIEKHLKSLKNGCEDVENTKNIISKIMYCFLNWLMVIPPLSKSTWMQIFEILERIYVRITIIYIILINKYKNQFFFIFFKLKINIFSYLLYFKLF